MNGGLSHGASQPRRPSTAAVIAAVVAALVVPALVVLIFSVFSSEETADPGPAPSAGHGAPADDAGVPDPAGGVAPPVGPSCEAEGGDPIRYIGTSGSDDADGLTAETAWATMQHAVENAPAGATAYLLKGAYPGFAWGTYTGRTGYVTFRPNPGDRVAIGGFYTRDSSTRTDWVAFDCLTVTGTLGAKVRGDHVRYTNLRVPSAPLSIEDGSSDVLIEGNQVGGGDPLPDTCIGLWSSYAEPKISDVTIRANRCEGLGYVGMNLRNFERVVVEGNVVAGIVRPGPDHSDAIRTFNGGRGLVVRRNLIRDNAAIGFFVKDGEVTDLVFENNVIGPTEGRFNGLQVYDLDRAVIANNTIDDTVVFLGQARRVALFNNIFKVLSASNGATVTFACNRNNLFSRPGNLDPGSDGLVANPQYVAHDDWRLRAGSPGVDGGTAACGSNAASRVDRDATPRPRGGATDIGAYER